MAGPRPVSDPTRICGAGVILFWAGCVALGGLGGWVGAELLRRHVAREVTQ